MDHIFDLTEERYLRAANVAMKLFVVGYSVTENTTSIRTLEQVLRDNYKRVWNGVPKDYLPVGIFKSRTDAERFDLHFHTFVIPAAQLMAGSQRGKHIADCFATELDGLMQRIDVNEK